MLFAVCYGLGAGAFLVLIVLMLLNRRPRGLGFAVLAACAITAVWGTSAAVQPWWMPGIAHSLESVSMLAWLSLIGWIIMHLRIPNGRKSSLAWFPLVLLAVGFLSVANDLRFVLSALGPWDFTPSQILARIAVAVCGILATENLYRNTPAGRRWNMFPFCIALGALFAYDLFAFCEAVVLRAPDPALLAARGLVLVLMVPPLALTMARNPEWKINVHVSRDVVFHGATLSAAGVFVLLAGGAASLIGKFPGEWATVSEIGFFCGSIVLLLVALSTESFRSRLKRVIAENFFSARYDYRVEWVRSIATLTANNADESLGIRAIRALADAVDSPGGALWMENPHGDYAVERSLNMRVDPLAIESRQSALVKAIAAGETVQDLSGAKGTGSEPAPAWTQSNLVWLAVPLMRADQMIGFVVLAPPRAPAVLNWESCNLLLTIGQQVAGFLAEERATRALTEAQSLIDYSKKFSFVVHDIKNVAGQLRLMVANIQNFGDRAEFRADLVRNLDSSVKKLNDLVARLRPNAEDPEAQAIVDPVRAINDVASELNSERIPLRLRFAAEGARVQIAPSALNAIVAHLLRNAIEASADGNAVAVELVRDKGHVLIDVVDEGSGMSAEFIRNSLFTPLRSTKARGHGIGAFQARDLARAAGGDIEVKSVIGKGTRMRVVLPEWTDTSAETFAARAVAG